MPKEVKKAQSNIDIDKLQAVSDLGLYLEALRSSEIIRAEHLCGRILRGTAAQDFQMLSDDPMRKLVMLMAADGLSLLPGKSGYEMLLAIGYHPDYIVHKVRAGTQFKLIVFPENDEVAKSATWDNTLDLISVVYPDIAITLNIHREQLKLKTFSEIETITGTSFLDIEKAGKNHPLFMTYDRFLASPMSLADIRAFLYFTVQLRELYSGDGYIYDSKGQRGMQEFVALNRSLLELGEHALFDLNMELPE